MRPLGAGGMAQVWLATRADGAFKREVALKLPLLPRLRMDLESRFMREREILAGLEHLNIARLYDGGIESEVPYLAMEFVQGQPFADWCDANRLEVRERVKLFQQVLAAVQYAHERHVIHRDIKPSNILVTEAGQVRLLDFGIAKLLEEESEQPELTQIYGRALTPEYASPELLRGDSVDIPSDIYSLGVLLYELLCGSRPYRVKPGTSREELARAIARRDIRRPSRHIKTDAGLARGTTLEELARDLRGDLDAIALKAMAKDPVDRYPSASALSDDLQRYLDGEPVQAQRLRFSYVLRKFVVRNRVAVAVSAAAFVLSVAGYQLVRAEFERVRAEAAAAAASTGAELPISEKSVAVLPFTDLSEKHDQEYLSDGLSEELIDRLSKSRDLKVLARTSSFSFKGKSEDPRAIGAKLGAANLLEGSVRKSGNALRVTVQLIQAKDRQLLWSQTYNSSLEDVFRVQDEIAEEVTLELKAALDAGVAPWVGDPPIAAYNLVLKGNFYYDRYTKDDVERAVALYRESISVEPRYALAWARLAEALTRQIELGSRRPEPALSQARDALKQALEIDPGLPIAHYLQGEIHLFADWDWAAAASEVDRMHATRGADALYRAKLRADISLMFGNLDDAISNYRQVIDHDPLNTSALNNLAVALADAGDLQAAVSAYREQLQLSPASAYSNSSLAGALLMLGRLPEALDAAERESDVDARHGALAGVYWALGRRAESDGELKKLETAPGQNSYGIAQIYALRSDKDAAMRWLERAYQEHDPSMPWVKADAFLSSVHANPRYRALLAKMGLNGQAPPAAH